MDRTNLIISSLIIGAAVTPYLRRLSLPLDNLLASIECNVQAKLVVSTTTVLRSILPSNRAPMIGDTEISAEWLTTIFKQKQIIGDQNSVKQVIISDLRGNRGLTGAISRLTVEYTNADPKLPTSFILKLSPIQRIKNVIQANQKREAIFYNQFKDLIPENLPQIIYSETSYSGVVIILEDAVRTSNGKGVNFFFGNQVWGVPPEMQSDQVEPLVALEEMFKLCAKIQAKHWNDRKLLQQNWLKASGWYRGQDRAYWELAMNSARRSWQACKTNLIPSGNVKFSEKLISIIDQSLAHTSWENLQRHLQDRSVPFTLTHGDFHAANMIWVKDSANPIRLVDWSEVGVWEPTADLGQTIISDVRPEVWRGNDERLLQAYWDTLIANGVSAEEFPFETCKAQYARSGVERWIWVFCVLSVFPGVPPIAVQYFHDQLLAFIEAHGDQPFYELKPVVVVG